MKIKLVTSLMLLALLGTPTLAEEEAPEVSVAPPPLVMSSKLTLKPTGTPPVAKAPVAVVAPTSINTPITTPTATSSGSSKFLLIAAGLGLGALLGGGLGRRLGWRGGLEEGQVAADAEVRKLRNALVLAKTNASPSDHVKESKNKSKNAAANDQWHTTVSTLERDVRDKNSLIDQLRDKLSSTEAETGTLAESIESLNEEHKKSVASLSKRHLSTVDKLQREHAQVLSARETKLNEQYEKLKASHDDTVKEIGNQHAKAIEEQRGEREALEEQLTALTEELAEVKLAKQTLETQVVESHESIANADQKIIHLTELTERQEKQQAQLEEHLAETQNTGEELIAELAAAQKKATDEAFKREEATTPLQKQIEILQNEIIEREADNRALVNELEPLRKQTEQIDELRAAMKLREEELAKVQAKLDATDNVQSELEDLTARYNVLDQQAQQEAEERKEANDRLLGLADVIEVHDTLQVEHTNLTTERDRMSGAVKELENQLAAASAEIEKKETSSSELKQQLEQSIAREKTNTEALEKLQQELTELQKTKSKTQEDTNQLNEIIAKLESEQSKLLQKLSDSQQLIESNAKQHDSVVADITRQANDLENEIERITAQHTQAAQENSAAHKQLEKITAQLAARDNRLKEITKEQKKSADALKTSQDDQTQAAKTIKELQTQVEELQTRLKDQADQTSTQLALDQDARNKRNRQLDEMEQLVLDATGRSNDLEEQLKAQAEELESRKTHNIELNAELIDLRADSESQRRKNIELHARLNKENSGEDHYQEIEELNETLRQRNILVNTLENQLNRAVKFAEELQESIENMQLESAAEKDKPERDEKGEPEPVSKELVVRMQKQLKAQVVRIRKLENDVKVHRDLVKVFENDSTQLHNAEERLEEITETATFLQQELTAAVTENRVLREQLDKNSKRLARHENIGRTLNTETIEHQKLMSRVAALEAENQELMQSLKSS